MITLFRSVSNRDSSFEQPLGSKNVPSCTFQVCFNLNSHQFLTKSEKNSLSFISISTFWMIIYSAVETKYYKTLSFDPFGRVSLELPPT